MKAIRNVLLSLMIVSIGFAMVPANVLAASEPSQLISANSYKDIEGGWYQPWAEKYGYPDIFTNGDGCFHPDQNITRMEFARMLHQALDININYFTATDISEFYNDVKQDDAGANELYDMTISGITDIKGSFLPAEPLSREEMIHFVMNAFYHFTGNEYAIPAIALQPFTDDSEINATYRTDISRSVILGLVNGRGDNTVSPRAEATRAEAVTIAGRLAALLNEYQSNVAVKASAYESGDSLILTLSIMNNTQKSVAISHNNGQYFDFVIQDENGKELYRWSNTMSFTQALSTTGIDPGKEIVYSAVLDAQTYASIKDKITTVKAYITGTSDSFTISPDGYTVSLFK